MIENKLNNKTISQKMGIRDNFRAFFVNMDNNIKENMHLPALDIATKLNGKFDYIHLFVKTQLEFQELFPTLKKHLNIDGMIWVSWPKGRRLDTGLSIKIIIKLGYDFGMVESTCLSINHIWSGLKFTHPKKGKIYKNSYGKLNRKESTPR